MEPNSHEKQENAEKQPETASRPDVSLWMFVAGLFILIFVVKFVSCTVLSRVNVLEEMQKAQNPPQVKIVP